MIALLFDGTNDSLQSASNVDLSGVNKLSVAYWLWWDVNGTNDDQSIEHSATAANAGTFVMDMNVSDGTMIWLLNGNVGFTSAKYTRPSAAAWHHYVLIGDFSAAGNAEANVYVDGALLTPSSRPDNNNNTGNFISATLNVMSRNNTTLFGAGRMAELAIYPGEVLNVSEALALTRGVNPQKIRPSSNPYYWPLWGLHTAEPCLRSGGPNLTVNGAVLTNHAPVMPFTDTLWTTSLDEIAVATTGQPTMRRWGGIPHMTPGGARPGRSW